MALEILVPISTEVIEKNPDCIIDGKYKDGALVINIDARKQDYHQQLGLPQTTKIHWGKEYTVPCKSCPSCPGQSDMKSPLGKDGIWMKKGTDISLHRK